MPNSSDGITYKSIVITLIGIVIALISFIGARALVKLDDLQMSVITLQATKTADDKDNARLSDTVRVLSAQVDFLTRWMQETFGEPKPKSQSQFSRD